MKNKFLIAVATLFFSLVTKAQHATVAQPQMADGMRADGKIYVVIAVIAITFISLICYLIYIDVKLRKLEGK